ncbi:MAG: hypothetical protein ACOX8W_13280 [bacterium]|jgi:hypothetical protein
MVCPPANTEPSDPILTFGRLPDNPFGSSGNLGSAITDPYTANLPGFFSFIAGIIWISAGGSARSELKDIMIRHAAYSIGHNLTPGLAVSSLTCSCRIDA